MANIYQYLDYKIAIKEIASEKRKSLGARFTFESIAKAARVQKAYLSRVLNHNAELNRDQLFRVGQYLGLSKDEREYLLWLHEAVQTTIAEVKSDLQGKIKRAQRAHSKTEANIKVNTEFASNGVDRTAKYHLDPLYPLVHMFLSIEEYSSRIDKIAVALRIETRRAQAIVEDLGAYGFVAFENNRWKILKDDIHLSKDNPLYPAYRNLMRLKALERLNQASDDSDYSFSVILSTEPEVRALIQREFLNFLSRSKELVAQGKESAVYQINFDFLKWG